MAKAKDVITRAEAKKLMWEYYRDNKASLPKWIRECREEILTQLALGEPVVGTFSRVVGNETQDMLEEDIAA
jgi:hypothetical protein